MNKKIFGIITVLLGAVVISLGITLQFNKKDEDSKEKEQDVSQNVEIKNINNFGDKEVCSNSKQISTFINTYHSDKISFTYPDCVHEYDLSDGWKQLDNVINSSDNRITISINYEDSTIDKYMSRVKTRIISDKEDDDYVNLEYSDVQKFTNKNGLEVQLIQEIKRVSRIYPEGSFYDNEYWYIAVKLTDEEILKIEISVRDGTMSKDVIKEFFDNVKIEKGQADFISVKKEGDYQVGSIRQNKNGEYEHGYIVNFKIPNKYPKEDRTKSNYYYIYFYFEELNQLRRKISISLTLEKETINSLEKTVENYNKYSLEYYNEDKHYRNIQDSKVIKKNLAGKDILYFIVSGDYYLDGKKSSTYYSSKVYYKIDDTMFYCINISNVNEPVDDKFISELLDFTIEEY